MGVAASPSRVLLDTHALLWALSDPQRLGEAARRTIADRDVRLFVSAASASEIATKHRLGKLPDGGSLVLGYPQHLARLHAEELPITTRHALAAGGLQWPHRDPFDRMLAAQSMLDSLPLVTADPAFSTYSGVRTIW